MNAINAFRHLFRKDEGTKILKNDVKSRKELPWNVYGDATADRHYFSFHRFHFNFKYKMLLPILGIAKWLIGKDLYAKIPDEPQNNNLNLFLDCWEESLRDWCIYYREGGKLIGDMLTKEIVHERLNDPSSECLRTIGRIGIYSCYKDTAYKEFFNILAHNWAKKMLDFYKDKDVHHLFYTSPDMYDTTYYIWWQRGGVVDGNPTIYRSAVAVNSYDWKFDNKKLNDYLVNKK